MDLCVLFILVSLFTVSQSQPTTHNLNLTDVEAAITDIRSQNFFGFAMLLQILKVALVHKYQDLTFFLPIAQELTKHSLSPDHPEDFLLKHSIPMPLTFSDLKHFPTGTMVPSGLEHQLIEIKNRGKADFSVNNALVTKPNLCVNSSIKCHGIDSVIEF